jgi:MFS family permease
MWLPRGLEMFTPQEKQNIAIYIGGIMLYKFGLEAFNGSIATLAQDRFNAQHTFTKWGALTGLNQAMQCVGSIMIAPLIRRYPTRTVLSLAILAFGLLTAILLIVDREFTSCATSSMTDN